MREAVRLAGQRVMVGFDGVDPTPEVRELIRDHGVGGIVLFSRNVVDPEQLVGLVRELQEIARGAGHGVPLLIGIDQEGGRVARLGHPWTSWPPLRALGRAGISDLARRLGQALARELSPLGVRWDFAPVVDVDTNPANPVIGDRSLGAEPDQVGTMAAAFVGGLQSGGVAACAKHFPGHGDTSVDSHVALPVLDHSPARLEDVELRPFREVIGAGVASVMTGHLLVREVDAERPATLSPRILGDMLRTRLSFQGVVVSDDLEMKAVADSWPGGEAARLAAVAGCDVLLVCHSPDRQAAAHEALVRALESEVISWTDFEDSVGRVQALKERFAGRPDLGEARAVAGCVEHRLLAEEILRRAGERA
jgi:beta-N-acetylhexosaminidase